jgi:hypothetical protein
MSTPEGQAFLTKFGQIETILEPLEAELLVQIMPGMLRRMADKVEASERARAASR